MHTYRLAALKQQLELAAFKKWVKTPECDARWDGSRMLLNAIPQYGWIDSDSPREMEALLGFICWWATPEELRIAADERPDIAEIDRRALTGWKFPAAAREFRAGVAYWQIHGPNGEREWRSDAPRSFPVHVRGCGKLIVWVWPDGRWEIDSERGDYLDREALAEDVCNLDADSIDAMWDYRCEGLPKHTQPTWWDQVLPRPAAV